MEPWLRGTKPHSDPIIRAVLHSFEQVDEDLTRWTAGLTDGHVWKTVEGLPTLGFQLRHIAGSIDRLTTYVNGEQLQSAQVEFLRIEHQPGASLAGLLDDVRRRLGQARRRISHLTDFAAVREVGRQKLPTTVGGLLVHLAEHTQRHLGQAISTCKLLMR